MLEFLDVLLTLTHLSISGFNLCGWIWKSTRKAHLICVLATAFSWFILGIWYGWGYCFVTDWQWDIKRKLGETHLPSSFIKYYADKTIGKDINSSLVDTITAISFGLVALISVYLNLVKQKNTSEKNNP